MPPNGVSMRLPPARGLAGSAVWQLAQSAGSTSALPRAIASGEAGSARAQAGAAHKSAVPRTLQRIARIALFRPPHHRAVVGALYPDCESRAAVTSFRGPGLPGHNAKTAATDPE